jgi:hypothetical protein
VVVAGAVTGVAAVELECTVGAAAGVPNVDITGDGLATGLASGLAAAAGDGTGVVPVAAGGAETHPAMSRAVHTQSAALRPLIRTGRKQLTTTISRADTRTRCQNRARDLTQTNRSGPTPQQDLNFSADVYGLWNLPWVLVVKPPSCLRLDSSPLLAARRGAVLRAMPSTSTGSGTGTRPRTACTPGPC